MPQVDIPYIVGVIREKEKALLETDEYTRMLQAPSVVEAFQALNDTAYGVHVTVQPGSLQALSARLAEELAWLVEMLGAQHRIIAFITARFDALRVAAALIDVRQKVQPKAQKSSLGSLSDELLASCLWHDSGWDDVPLAWREFLQAEVNKVQQPQWSKHATIERVTTHMLAVMTDHAGTPLTDAIVAFIKARLAEESHIRPDNLPDDLIAYERAGDEALLALLRPWRADPTSSDAIVAWWYVLVSEVKTVRLLLTAKRSGFSAQLLERLPRSLYRTTV